MVDASRAKVINSAFGTAIGQMRLEGVLTDTQIAAAHHFARFMGHYDRSVGNPSRTARSPDYQMGRAGMGVASEESLACNVDDGCPHCEARRRASSDYDRLRNMLPNAEWSVAYHTVLLNESCPWPHRPALISALNMLAELFGYAAPKRRIAA